MNEEIIDNNSSRVKQQGTPCHFENENLLTMRTLSYQDVEISSTKAYISIETRTHVDLPLLVVSTEIGVIPGATTRS
jgi:hypothetical protein